MSQLALPLKLQDHAVFESFHATGNDELFAFLTELTAEPHGPGCFVWGTAASGKTHLLQAVCERVGDQSIYVPLGEFRHADAAVLQGLADRHFVCLDDLQQVLGNPDWELALFELCNQISDNTGILIASADARPKECGIALADLESRLSKLPVFRCNELQEIERIKALKLRAGYRGLELPDDTASYLLSRSRRDMRSLYELLDRLDTEAMIAKRRLTIPFVRDVLQSISQPKT